MVSTLYVVVKARMARPALENDTQYRNHGKNNKIWRCEVKIFFPFEVKGINE
jgi:hypothetical protein